MVLAELASLSTGTLVLYLLSTVVLALVLTFILGLLTRPGPCGDGSTHCMVLVLGDIGRSPRMQYHCLSLASHGYMVHLVGYDGATPHENITTSPRIKQYHIPQGSAALGRLPRSVAPSASLCHRAPSAIAYQRGLYPSLVRTHCVPLRKGHALRKLAEQPPR